MNREIVIDKIKGLCFPSEEKDKIIKWVQHLPNMGKVSPSEVKIGDVFYHPVFKHPYIVLNQLSDEGFACCIMTSDEMCPEILCEVKSRFFSGYVAKTLFRVKTPLDHSFVGVYENQRQIAVINKKLLTIFNDGLT